MFGEFAAKCFVTGLQKEWMNHFQSNIGKFQCFSFEKLHGQKLIQVFILQISEFLPAGALKSTQSDQSNNSYSRPHNTTTNTMLNHRKISKDGGMSCTTEQQDF